MRYAKGHGTGNDFIIVPDLDDRLELGPDVVRRLCDRHTGIGADGVLRVVGRASGPAPWFMDYRNGDGSIAEMCGNGIRVFARYLIDHGLADGPDLAIATRAGVRIVRQEAGGELTVDMGPVTVGRAGSGDQLWTVDVPGGRLAVAPSATASLLTGPAVIVAEGETCASWLTDPLVTAAATA